MRPLIPKHRIDTIPTRPDLAMTSPAQRQQVTVCQPVAAVSNRNDMMHHVGLLNQPAHLAPTTQRILCHVCSPDRLPPSIIPTRSSRPASIIVAALRLMICAPVTISHDLAAPWVLAIPRPGLVRIAVTASDDLTAAGKRTESFRGCCHGRGSGRKPGGNTDRSTTTGPASTSPSRSQQPDSSKRIKFFDIKTPQSKIVPCGAEVIIPQLLNLRQDFDKKITPDFSEACDYFPFSLLTSCISRASSLSSHSLYFCIG